MQNVNVHCGTCVSAPSKATKNKPSVEGRPYTLMFIRPADLPQEFIAQRVKGTGKSPILPEGMELVWSLTHDAWRVFNTKTQVGELVSFKAEADTVEHVGTVHRQQIMSNPVMMQAYRPDLYEQQQAEQQLSA
jgi:hypothetical protein